MNERTIDVVKDKGKVKEAADARSYLKRVLLI